MISYKIDIKKSYNRGLVTIHMLVGIDGYVNHRVIFCLDLNLLVGICGYDNHKVMFCLDIPDGPLHDR